MLACQEVDNIHSFGCSGQAKNRSYVRLALRGLTAILVSLAMHGCGVFPVNITTANLPDGTEGVAYNARIAVVGGTAPVNIHISSLPPGLVVNSTTGDISGTPTTPGTFDLTVVVTDANDNSISQSYRVRILGITTTNLPPAIVANPYHQSLAALGTVGAVVWSLPQSSQPPPGLQLGADGTLSGTPTSAGTFTFNVTVTDTGDTTLPNRADTRQITVQVVGPITVSVTPPTASLLIPLTASALFQAVIPNDTSNQGIRVNWRLTGANCTGAGCGTLLLANGAPYTVEYDPPNVVPAPDNTVTLTATSVADPTKSGSARITLTLGLDSLAISPASSTVSVGGLQQYTAAGHFGDGTSRTLTNAEVTWSTPDTSLATIDSSGLATALAAGDAHVTATVKSPPLFPPSVTDTVVLHIASAGIDFSVTAAPASQVVTPGGSTGYTVTVTPSNGFAGNVNLSVSGLPPAGFTATFNPTSVSGSGNSTLTVTADASLTPTPNPIPLTIAGTSGALIHSVPVALSVVKAGVLQTVDLAGDGSSFLATIGTTNHFVAFFSNSSNLVSPATTQQNVFLIDIPGASTTLVSAVNGSSPPIEGDSTIFDQQVGFSAMSDNGQVVAFASNSTNLISPGTTDVGNVFLRYTCAGVTSGCTPSTVLGSVNASGLEPTAVSGGPPAMSPDGRYLLFTSDAKDIVSPAPAASSLGTELYLRDTCKNSDGTSVAGGCIASNTLISQSTAGIPSGTMFAIDFASTPGGRFVTFSAASSQLAATPDTQVFLRDTCGLPNQPVSGCTPTTTLLSQSSTGVPGLGGSSQPSISADRRFVVFSSGATNFPGAMFTTQQVYLRDTCQSLNVAGLVPNCDPIAPLTLISVAADNTTSGNGESITASHSLSADGRFILFKSEATNLVSNSPPAFLQGVYVRDTCRTTTGPVPSCTPVTHLLSVDASGTFLTVQNTLADAGAAISRDGHYAVFDYNNGSGFRRIALAATGF